MTLPPRGGHLSCIRFNHTKAAEWTAEERADTPRRLSPELHPAVDQSQRDEVLLALLAVVEQDAGHLGRSELHGDADRVVGAHGLERQVWLASKWRDEVLDDCGGMKTTSQSCHYYMTRFIAA